MSPLLALAVLVPAAPPPFARGAEVLQLLEKHCVECHGGKVTRAGLDLTTRPGLLAGGENGPAVVPGKSADSLLLRQVRHAVKPGMPFRRERLADAQVSLLAGWVDAGAPYDRPLATGKSDKKELWWSLKPLVRPAVPPTRTAAEAAWARTPIDHFVLARLRERGLSPAPEADRRTLLRRVTFDLTGLPPTPEEVDAFLADPNPGAYERAVERLLASPHYGERWARHWMDVARFAETHGHDQDRPRENAWPYRDYLVRAFNADRPYARFVQEQVAGDVLFPEDADGVVALGFLAAGPWDESSLRDIREDTLDREIARYLDRDDIVATVATTFLGATVHCARCHDHKFDPISQEEYYALQSVFAGVDKANREYDADPATAARRKKLAGDLARLQGGAGPEWTHAVAAEVAAWEAGLAGRVVPWTVLTPAESRSANGSTLTAQADGSLLSGGKKPATDVYTIVAHTDLKGITAIRLEVLTDPSLPHKGPGRQDNGNLHLNELKVQAAPRNKPTAVRPVVVHSPAADFDQEGWTAAHAIDGNPATAWGIYPRVGQPHHAVFVLREPVTHEGGTTFTFTLEQTHGGSHLIGRPRLSVTTAADPQSAAPLPDAIARILAVPVDKRAGADKGTLAKYVQSRRLERELAALPAPRLVYAAAADYKPDGSFKPFGKPRPVHMLRRGDITKPLAEAKPGALSMVPGLEGRFSLPRPEDEGARRVALARWLTDPGNVLAWRSAVNRVWHHHFGKGIVDTPGDLGRMGAQPSHPQLLDWLAVTFRDGGGSLKDLHRLIVTSAVYRQSSRHDAKAAALDGDNRLLWRMNRARLDAESLRDAVLLVAGQLDRGMGGPSVKQFVQKPGIHVTPIVDYLAYDIDRPETRRRSVYRFLFRTLPDPFMEVLDCPDGAQQTPARTVSVTAQQALALLHNRFVVRMSEHLADRLAQDAPDLPGRVRSLYRRALGREPTEKESRLVVDYAGRHGLANACRMLLNSNEFLFVN